MNPAVGVNPRREITAGTEQKEEGEKKSAPTENQQKHLLFFLHLLAAF